LTGRFDWNLDAETLEIDDGGEDNQGCEQVHDVGQMLSVESLAQGSSLVRPGDEKMEEGNDSSLKLLSSSGVNGSWGEGLPDNGFTDVGGDEQRDTGAETISLLQQFIEENDDQTSKDKLDNQKKTDASTEIARLTIEASKDEDAGLTKGQDDGK